MTIESKQEKTKSDGKPGKNATKCDVKNLVSPGAGLWKYAHAGLTFEEAKNKAFFAEALEKFGMRAGDVVFVHAGNGTAFLVGV